MATPVPVCKADSGAGDSVCSFWGPRVGILATVMSPLCSPACRLEGESGVSRSTIRCILEKLCRRNKAYQVSEELLSEDREREGTDSEDLSAYSFSSTNKDRVPASSLVTHTCSTVTPATLRRGRRICHCIPRGVWLEVCDGKRIT